jgi:hypothetical protein
LQQCRCALQQHHHTYLQNSGGPQPAGAVMSWLACVQRLCAHALQFGAPGYRPGAVLDPQQCRHQTCCVLCCCCRPARPRVQQP